MKRKLSLVMAFMMAATLVPASVSNAASKNTIKRTLSVTSSETISGDATTGNTLYVKGDGATTNVEGVFHLELGEGAEWNYDYNKKYDITNATVEKISSTLLEVTPVGGQQIEVPMNVKLDGAPSGPQKVKVIPRQSTVTAGDYTYATVSDSEVKIRVDKKVKISRGTEEKVSFLIEEVTKKGLDANSKVTLKLPSGFTWKANGEREITIDAVGTDSLDTISKSLVIVPDRKAPFGDVDVTITGKEVSINPSSLVVAEYIDYGITVKADKVLDVIAGKDIDGKYKSKVTIEESATGSLAQNRYIEFTFVDENGKSVDASLQHGQSLKLSNKGNKSTEIVIDKGSIAGYGSGSDLDYKVATMADKKDNVKASEFDLHVKNVDTNKRSKYELDVPFVVDSGFKGKLFLKVKGAGIEETLVQIADVKAPVTFEVKKPLPQVKIGLQKQPGSDIMVKETEAGALQDGTRSNTNKVKYTIEPSEQFGLTFKSAKVEVTEGNISIDDSGKKDKMLYVEVDRKSTKASTITFKDITVTLDRTVPYGEIKLKGNFGVVGESHDLSNTVETFDYFTTVTPVATDKRITTVFKIDDKNYSEVVGAVKEDKMADVAPFIKENRTMLPVRYVANAIGAEVNYDPMTRVATFQKDQTVVSINIDKDMMYVNGSPVKLFTKPANVEGRIFLPLVNVAQAFGLKQGETIIWNAEAKTVTILPQDATAEEIQMAKDGKVVENATPVAEENKSEEKKEEAPATEQK